MELVIDASALLRGLVDEAAALRMAVAVRAADSLLAPDSLASEVASGLWRYAQAGVITTEQAVARLEEVQRYPIQLVSAEALLPEALRIACELPHPVYDCLYLLLALHGGRTLATADARLRDAGRALGVRVEWVGRTGLILSGSPPKM